MDKQAIAQSMAAYRDVMVRATVELCAIPSVKGRPETGAPFGLETKRSLDALLALGAELGFTPVDLDGYCGYLDWGSEGPITAVLGHLDVVPASMAGHMIHSRLLSQRTGSSPAGQQTTKDRWFLPCMR
ncbi:MAG: hypothetical protein LRY35_03650 [Clostridiales bacterium]|nr:hypothetical protein [Clostridiales bacterium]